MKRKAGDLDGNLSRMPYLPERANLQEQEVIQMATIRKRGNSYQIDYFDPTGKRVRKSFKKKKDAENELAARVVSIGDGSYFEKAKTYTPR